MSIESFLFAIKRHYNKADLSKFRKRENREARLDLKTYLLQEKKRVRGREKKANHKRLLQIQNKLRVVGGWEVGMG